VVGHTVLNVGVDSNTVLVQSDLRHDWFGPECWLAQSTLLTLGPYAQLKPESISF
jgi:hypothetical protein